MTTAAPRTTPAPRPLPALWERAIANSIHQHLTRTGWATAKELRTWHPTGAPRTGGHSTARNQQTQVSNTDLLSVDVYAWGIVDPDKTKLPTPPLAWLLKQLPYAGALTPEQQTTADAWLEAHRRSIAPNLFTPQLNRHGQPSLRRNAYADVPPEVCEVFLIAARTAVVHELDADALDEAYASAVQLNVAELEALLVAQGV